MRPVRNPLVYPWGGSRAVLRDDQRLSLQQKLVLRTIATEPTTQPMAANYIARYRLGSAGGVRHSLMQLEDLDLVEKERTSETWRVVDPVFALYLRLKQ